MIPIVQKHVGNDGVQQRKSNDEDRVVPAGRTLNRMRIMLPNVSVNIGNITAITNIVRLQATYAASGTTISVRIIRMNRWLLGDICG